MRRKGLLRILQWFVFGLACGPYFLQSAEKSPDLSVVNSVDRSDYSVGDEVVFTAIVRNVGDEEVRGVKIADVLPSAFDSAIIVCPEAWSPVVLDHNMTCQMSPEIVFAPGAEVKAVIRGKARECADHLTNSIVVMAEKDRNFNNNTSSVDVMIRCQPTSPSR